MRTSVLFSPTLRELPAEAEIPSHQLLLRAGMIRKAAAGIYTFLPLGYSVLKRIMHIIREEMDKAGGQELLLPIVQPAELWIESGRWDVYGNEMFRLNDRHERKFCLGPTHEEIITALIRTEISSYKQLPVMLYQIQNKYRDEKRPRFGLMRGREFIMKDLYSFDSDEEGMRDSYKKMYQAYVNIFDRCGLEYKVVEADSGAIGGSVSHEFMVLSDTGESEIVYCENCDYAANTEKAECGPRKINDSKTLNAGVEETVHTPNMKTIQEVSEYLNVPQYSMIKALLYEADGELVCVLIRGDRDINETKLKNTLDCINLELAGEEKIFANELIPGFVGPHELDAIKIIADLEVPLMPYAVTGANKKDYHLKGVVPERDIKPDKTADIRMIESGEPCPECDNTLNLKKGIEVGQIFELGTKYSDALDAVYTDESGVSKGIQMGCYGIGVSRTLAAVIEQHHDENGIIWPLSIAPFYVVIVPVSNKDNNMMEIADYLYNEMQKANIKVVLDDRDDRAGVKFKDADLIGYPYKIIIGKKSVENNTVDIKDRRNEKEETIEVDKTCDYMKNLIFNDANMVK